MPLVGAQSSDIETLDLRSYLEATLERHLTIQEHQALANAERLSLVDGQRYFWPDITARTSYDEVTSETMTSPSSRTVRSGITTGVDTTWTSWLGTDITLGLEHQYGRQLGQLNQGIPEDEMQAHNLSVEISQPLLKHNTLFYNRLPLHRAQQQWEQYHVKGELDRLTLFREAMLDFLAVQESYDRLHIEQERLETVQALANFTSALVEEGRSLAIDKDMAQLDVLRQEQTVTRARQALQQSQRALTLSWINSAHIEVVPMASTSALIDQLSPVLDDAPAVTHHPEFRQQRLRLDSALLEERARHRDRWPELSVYYRFEKNFRETLPDEESQSWGLRLSYDLFDLPTREQQDRLRAEATIARWNVEDQSKRLQWETHRLYHSSQTRLAELEMHNQVLELSQRAVGHELARYREGLASYIDVRNRQQDLQNRQSSALDTRVELARELIALAYHHQWDWLGNLP